MIFIIAIHCSIMSSPNLSKKILTIPLYYKKPPHWRPFSYYFTNNILPHKTVLKIAYFIFFLLFMNKVLLLLFFRLHSINVFYQLLNLVLLICYHGLAIFQIADSFLYINIPFSIFYFKT